MIAMARVLDLKVIAEGIETEAQLAILAEEGCDLFQGFLRAGADFARGVCGAGQKVKPPFFFAFCTIADNPRVNCTRPFKRASALPQARWMTILLSGRNLATPFNRST